MKKLIRYYNKLNNKSVNIDLDFSYLPINNLGILETIKGCLWLNNTKLNSFFNLREAEYIDASNIKTLETLGKLKCVSTSLILYNCPNLTSLNGLKYVGNNLDLSCTDVRHLGNLEFIGGDLNLYNTPISRVMTEDEIRDIIDIRGKIYFKA